MEADRQMYRADFIRPLCFVQAQNYFLFFYICWYQPNVFGM